MRVETCGISHIMFYLWRDWDAVWNPGTSFIWHNNFAREFVIHHKTAEIFGQTQVLWGPSGQWPACNVSADQATPVVTQHWRREPPEQLASHPSAIPPAANTTSLTSQARSNVRSLTLSQESDFTQWRTHTRVVINPSLLSETQITSHHVLKIVTDSGRSYGCPFAKCKNDKLHWQTFNEWAKGAFTWKGLLVWRFDVGVVSKYLNEHMSKVMNI